MILIGLGANLPTARYGAPRATLSAALDRLRDLGVAVVRTSPWYDSAPQPPSGQPRYVNAVVVVETRLRPSALLQVLHEVEAEFGRHRTVRNAARVIDLDLLAYRDCVIDTPGLTVPHPRLAQRAFVLLPLADVAPEWRHPVSGMSVTDLLAAMPPGQDVRRMSDRHG